jgi:hypothetical protein
VVLIEGLKREADCRVGKRARSWGDILEDVNKVAKTTKHNEVENNHKIEARFVDVLRPKYVTAFNQMSETERANSCRYTVEKEKAGTIV